MNIYRNRLLAFVGGLSLLLVVSCKKELKQPIDNNPPPVLGEPVVRPKGQPQADPFTAYIGPHGGVITYANQIRLEIPPGTVEYPMLFGIQPIDNTLDENSALPAFRLTPEGVRFKKPIKLSFLYPSESGGLPQTRMVAFQNNEGIWCGVSTTLDEPRQRLTVETDHFSDWVWFDFFSLRKSGESVGAGEQVELRLMEQILGALVPTNHIDEVPLAAMDEIGASKDVTVSNWKIVSGPGTLEHKVNTKLVHGNALYTAPSTVTEPTDVEIQVEIESKSGYIRDPNAPNGRRKFGKLILLTTIRLVPENFVQLKLNGAALEMQQTGNHASIANGMISIRTATQTPSKTITLQCNGVEPGTYSGGSEGNQSQFYLTAVNGTDRQFLNNFQRTCDDDYVYNGTTTITRVDEYIEGTFVGNLFPINVQDCEAQEPTAVEFKFRIKRNLL